MNNTPQTKKNTDESIESYLYRLGSNKDTYGVTWDEITILMNEESGESFSESKWRKDFSSFKRGYDYASSTLFEDEVYKKLTDKEIEIQKKTVQFRDQRREYNKLINEQGKIDGIRGIVVEAAHRLSENYPLLVTNKPKNTYDSNKEAALLLSDWHKGLFANSYWNKFDNNEFYKRVNKVVNRTIEDAKRHNVKTIHVFSLGDLINGWIHTTTRINSVEDVITQTMEVSESMAQVLHTLSNEFESVKFYNCRGNHDRVTPNKNDEIAKESFADIVPWFLKARLSHLSNIEFIQNTYDDEIITTEICGKTIFAVHGHRDRVGNVVENLTLMTKRIPDFCFMGHIHHHEENEVHGIEIVVNSSLSGVDAYAKEIRKTSKPAQKLIIFDNEEGRLATYNIRLDVNV
ncbi:hypothetical protein GRF59_15150 [Paenibacillus sp. HJL G12]|uniref:Calcineurin-like phosphoesterase domain-containing protein n=1 Tax=Paenibacillus dendrobii TaxID=2691084 RepID=A0A7X3IJ69_9BACL|nr:metallophosphoesterase family protein [Paenibacillus dendrobii]MWV44958.1 hypothetical protein [Paenibacillus dendrobii]